MDRRQSSLGKVSNLDASKYMLAYFEPKDKTQQDTKDEKYISQIKTDYQYGDIQGRVAKHIFPSIIQRH